MNEIVVMHGNYGITRRKNEGCLVVGKSILANVYSTTPTNRDGLWILVEAIIGDQQTGTIVNQQSIGVLRSEQILADGHLRTAGQLNRRRIVF